MHKLLFDETESSPTTSKLKTALIETQDLSKVREWSLPADQFANRASSLTPSSVKFLEDIGAWQHVDAGRVQAYDDMQVWDAANDATIQFDHKAEAQRYNAPPQTVASMAENSNLTKGLLERIVQLGGETSLLSSTNVVSIENGEDDPDGLNLSSWPVLSVSPNSTSSTSSTPRIAARLLVGADGFNSPVRNFAGIASRGWDYDRHGVVATLKVEPDETSEAASFDSFFSDGPAPNRATAYQRFLPQLGGPIAILPLPDHHASLVWSTTPAHAAYLKSLAPRSQIALINAALRLSQADIRYLFTLPSSDADAHQAELDWRLQHTQPPPLPPTRQPPVITSIQPNSLASFPLRFRHTTSLICPRVALIGDAAHTVHPLAGQGLNLGLADARSLAETISYAVDHGMDLGDSMTLERYSSDRFGQGLLMAGSVDALNSIYQLGGGGEGILATLAGRARGLGMKVVGGDMIPGLKSLIMRQAS